MRELASLTSTFSVRQMSIRRRRSTLAFTETEEVTGIDEATHTTSTSKKDNAPKPLAVASANEPAEPAAATQPPKTQADS
jgi:hypothetical protein